MGAALDDVLPGSVSAVSAWVERLAAPLLAERAARLARLADVPAPPPAPRAPAEVDVWKALAPPRKR